MDFDMHPNVSMNGINWERVLPPLFPRVNGTVGKYAWTPVELLLPESEHKGAAQVRNNFHKTQHGTQDQTIHFS